MEVHFTVLLSVTLALEVFGRAPPMPNIKIVPPSFEELIVPPEPPIEVTSPEATYVAIVPQYIRPNTDFSIPITFLKPYNQETVRAILIDRENKTIADDTVRSFRNSDVTLTLRAPDDISWGSYRVNISGSGDIPFFNSTHVWGKHKSLSVFVQTDKAMYKPGDKVKYRIFAINGAMDPVPLTMDVNFHDPKGNKIDELRGVSTGREGLQPVEGELELSDMPPLGNWRIVIEPKDFKSARTSYYFIVEEYVLPKFEVTVTLPKFGREDADFLIGKVNARYTFGKPVQGYLVLSVTKSWGRGFYDPRAIRTEMMIDGEAEFKIPRVALERLTRGFQHRNLRVHANVTESITGITLEGDSDITYHSNPYKIEFHPTLMPDNFKPGYNIYPVTAKVSLQDGRPPVDIREALKVTVTYYTDKPLTRSIPNSITATNYEAVSPFIDGTTIMMKEKFYPVGVDGMVNFRLDIPPEAATGTIKADFKGQTAYKEISRFRSPNDAVLKLEAASENPLKVGELAAFKLAASNKPLVGNIEGKYLVVARNKIVKSGTFTLRGADQVGLVPPFTVTRDMAPSSRLVAYYVTDDDEIVADGLNFAVDSIYENKVTVEFDQTRNVKPNTTVNLRVTADKDSIVNVLVYDRSLRLLKDGNDITRDRVENELNQYGDTPWTPRGWGVIPPWPVTADDSSDVFNAAQLKVLTNANLYSFNLWNLDQPQVWGRGVAADSFGGAKMMAMSGGAVGAANGASAPTGQIRTKFPETWIWTDSVANKNGFVDISANVPDTITTWEANAYALNPRTGLGVAAVTSNLTAFLPFFLAMQLPYSVVRGETAVIQANVFNYHPEDLQVLVTLRGSDDFVGIQTDSSGLEKELTGDLTQCVLVRSGKPTPVFFTIKPTRVDPISINVRIDEKKQRNIYDEAFKDLLVKPEGEPKEKNYGMLVSHMSQNDVTTKTTEIKYPHTVVPDSEKIRVTVFGDVFGPSLENLDSLIKMPYGCGEQNMLRFAPNVFAAVYMKTTNRWNKDPERQREIEKALRTGYQRQLVYQRHDGSFSAFGSADDEGSLWLTAFVIKSFAQAYRLNLILIDEKIIEQAVRFIQRHQTPDGNYENTGIVSHKAIQGGSAANERSLTAYVLIALQEVARSRILKDRQVVNLLTSTIDNATTYLDERIFLPITDYEAAIVSYALELVQSPMYAAFLNRLDESKNRTMKDGGLYWKNPSHALQVEIASYALLTQTLRRNKTTGMKILDWLVKQRNSYGGFVSTQDTVVALQALSEFATLVYSKDVDMRIDITTKKGLLPGKTQTIRLNSENHDVLQYRDFDGDVKSVVVSAQGPGLAVVDINTYYNEMADPAPPSYDLRLRTYDETENNFMLEACTRYLIPDSKSNMAIMRVGAPSGFEAQKEGLQGNSLIKRLETAGGQLIIYFDDIPPFEICLDIKMQRDSIALGLQPASVSVYSYYEPTEQVLVNYLPDTLKNVNDICSLCKLGSTSEMCSSCNGGQSTKILSKIECEAGLVLGDQGFGFPF